MLKHLLPFLFILATFQGFSQTANVSTGPEPIGGASKVVLPFYKIRFSPEQRAILRQQEIELIFAVDEQGMATLEDVQGVTDKAILDSIHLAATKVPAFNPRVTNGTRESSLFFLKFQLPAYGTQQSLSRQQLYFPNSFKKAGLDDFEYIHKSGQRLDMLIGIVVNGFIGKPGEYLFPGGGMKLDLLYTGSKNYGGGMIMGFYGNELKQKYPISSGREHNSAPPTLLLGAGINKFLEVKDRHELMAQLELCYAVQNITPKLDYNDEDWVQLQGFSPGLVINYLVKLGKDKAAYAYGTPSIFSNYLNIHGAVRPVVFNLKEATGIMLEAGVSYRLGIHTVDEYRLK